MTPTPYSDKAPATTENSAFLFYDIESLHNIFTVAVYLTASRHVTVYYLLDEDPDTGLTSAALEQALRDQHTYNELLQANPTLMNKRRQFGLDGDGAIRFANLQIPENARHLARIFCGILDDRDHDPHTIGASPLDPDFPIICDTHPDYDPAVDHFVAGYNSNQYDTTMLALYFASAFDSHGQPTHVSAGSLREHNDQIFALVKPVDPTEPKRPMPSYLRAHPRADAIRRNWLSTGRHFDVARLNELQAKVALKRLLGMLGHQILESDKLAGPDARIESITDAVELISYNISDTVGTSLLMEDPVYSGSFDLRSGLLRTYPETVFDRLGGNNYRTPRQNTNAVLRRWPRMRLTIDASSAQFAGRILAPYRDLRDIPGHVADLPVVSFRYPDPLRRDPGSPWPENVLTQTRDFFFDHVPTDTVAGKRAHTEFEQVYRYYRSIEGLSFNQTQSVDDAPLSVIGRIDHTLGQLAQDTDHQIATGAGQHRVALAQLLGHSPGPVRPGEPDSPREVSFTYGQFRAMFSGLSNWAHTALTPGQQRDVFIADLLRLQIIIQAWCDSAQPYWPADRPATRDQTLITWRPDNRYWRNQSYQLADVAKLPTNVPYYTLEGEPTSCFATFSTGGIHGAEAHIQRLAHDNRASAQRWARFREALDTAHTQWVGACNQVDADPQAAGDKLTEIVTSGRQWISGAVAAGSVPQVDTAYGTPYPAEQLAAAAWWIRQNIRIQLDRTDPDTGEPVVIEWGDLLKSGSKKNDPILREVPKGERARPAAIFTDKTTSEVPLVPPTPDGSEPVHQENRLDPRYRYTSVADVIHEDFTSYYPLMLVNLAAFTNPDLAEPGKPPRDKYSEIFDDKERYGKLRKDKSLTAVERGRYNILREGTKLILNAASGAADARHDTPILTNNMIVTMRIIGQLFSWRIGQAQTFAGGKIVSTNTDGLYSTLDWDTNQKVLDDHAETIGVEIEPEPLTLVSKDSNNRVEFLTAEQSLEILTDTSRGQPAYRREDIADKPWFRVVASAGGGTLACWDGPSPRKALAHSAMNDRLLLEYFKYIAGGRPGARIDRPMDLELGRIILDRLHRELSTVELLSLYQNLIASSPGASSYLYAVPYRIDPDTGTPVEALDSTRLTFDGDNSRRAVDNPTDPAVQRTHTAVQPELLGHYTRVFAVDPVKLAARPNLGDPVVIAAAKAATIPAARMAGLAEQGLTPPRDPVAAYLLTQAGEDVNQLRHSKDIKLARHSGVDPAEAALVFNHSLHDHPDQQVLRDLLDCIDTEVYLRRAAASFDENWRNVDPEMPD